MKRLAAKIRLRYSGLTVFGSRLFQIVSGFLFTVAVTRNLTTYEFGIWQNIGDLQNYFTVFVTLLPGWQVRYLARGERNAGVSGVVLNLMLSVPFALAFLFLSPLFARTFSTSAIYYGLAALQIIELYLIPALHGLSEATKPQVVGHVQTLREVVKIFFGLLLIVFFRLGVVGAIAAVAITYAFDIIYLSIVFRDLLQARVRFSFLRDWGKGAVLSMYGVFSGKIASLDVLLLILMVGVEARALYGAAILVGSLVTYATALSAGLYPRLLSGGGRADVESVMKLTFLFAIPMAAGCVAYSIPFLTILNPAYLAARPILILSALNSLIACFSAIFETVVFGAEKVDAEGGLTFRGLFKSSFFIIPTFGYLLTSAYIPLVYLSFSQSSGNPLLGAKILVLANTAVSLIGAAIRYRISKRRLDYRIPKVILKYVLSASVMAIALYLLPQPSRPRRPGRQLSHSSRVGRFRRAAQHRLHPLLHRLA
ncbi:MAG: hypothetical protein QW390_04075 [Candidatus Bathyarchaeia archaeon]